MHSSSWTPDDPGAVSPGGAQPMQNEAEGSKGQGARHDPKIVPAGPEDPVPPAKPVVPSTGAAETQQLPQSTRAPRAAGVARKEQFTNSNDLLHGKSDGNPFPSSMVDPRIKAGSRRSKLFSAEVLGMMVVVAMVPVLYSQGFRAFVSLFTLLMSLTTVQVAMRATLHSGLPYPYSLTAVHMLLTVGTACLAGPARQGELRTALHTLPASLAGGAAVIVHNVALTKASVSFVTMMGTCTPVITYLVELALGTRGANWKTAVPVLMACLGGALCVHGERTFSVPALVLVLLACVSRSLKSVWQQSLLSGAELSPARLAAWGGVWTFFLTLPFAATWEGWGLVRSLHSAPSSCLAAASISCVAAVALNLSQWTSLQYLGPVMQHMFGNLQLVFVLILASLWLNEDCSPHQMAGTGVLVLGVLVVKVLPQKQTASLSRPRRSKTLTPGYSSAKRSSEP